MLELEPFQLNEFGSNALCSVSKQVWTFWRIVQSNTSGGRGGRSNVNNSLTYKTSNNNSSLGQCWKLRAFLEQKTIEYNIQWKRKTAFCRILQSLEFLPPKRPPRTPPARYGEKIFGRTSHKLFPISYITAKARIVCLTWACASLHPLTTDYSAFPNFHPLKMPEKSLPTTLGSKGARMWW